MKKHLEVYDLPLTCDMMQDMGLKVSRVWTNDPHYTKDNRPVRNVMVEWSVPPEDHEKSLAEWCLSFSPTVKHV